METSHENNPVTSAQQLLNEQHERKMATITHAVEAHQQLAQTEAAYEQAKMRFASAVKDATKAGWTAADLKHIGISVDGAPVRRSRRKKPEDQTGSQPASPTE